MLIRCYKFRVTQIYKATLQNNLKLSVDLHNDNPLVALSVSVGSGRFYEDCQVYGLTHLIEHCIFAPNKNYPEIGSLTKYIDNSGGEINAWTDNLSTNFHLTCPPNMMLDCLNRLFDKLFYPQFNEANINAEITAIDAEFNSKKNDEAKRLLSVQQFLCNPTHPFSRFAMGNETSLRSVTLKQLISQCESFHQAQFAANNIAVALSYPDAENNDNEALKRLISETKELLESLPASSRILSLPTTKAFEALPSHQLVSVSSKSIGVIFSLIIDKHENEQIDNLALTMLESLITSRHKFGLVDTLQRELDLHELIVKNGFEDNHQIELQLCMSFSSALQHNIEKICEVFFGYIDFVIQNPPEIWRFREKQRQLELQARFANKPSALTRTILKAETLRDKYLDEDSSSNITLESIEVDQRLRSILSFINETKISMYVLTDSVNFDQSSPFYDVPFSLVPFEFRRLSGATAIKFANASQNAYLPTSLQVFMPHGNNAQGLKELPNYYGWDSSGLRLDYWFFCKDQKPLGDIYVSFSIPLMFGNSTASVAKRIWLECLQNHLKTHFFQTKDAGLYYRVYGHQRGICIHTSGFTERQILLIYDLINIVNKYQVSRLEFEKGKKIVGNKINRSFWQKPINKLFSELTVAAHSSVLPPEHMLDAINNLTFDEFESLQQHYFDSIAIESLMIGNWPLVFGDKLHKHLVGRFEPNLIDSPTKDEIAQHKLPSSITVDVFGTQEQGFMLYQSFGRIDRQESELKPIAISLIIEVFLSPLIFVEMRNVRKIGYNLGIGYKPIEENAGIVVYAQSSRLNQAQLKQQMLDGLNTVIRSNKTLGIDLNKIKLAVCEQIGQPLRSASELGRFIWLHYDNPDPLNYVKTLKDAVTGINEDDFWTACESLLQENKDQILLSTRAHEESLASEC